MSVLKLIHLYKRSPWTFKREVVYNKSMFIRHSWYYINMLWTFEAGVLQSKLCILSKSIGDTSYTLVTNFGWRCKTNSPLLTSFNSLYHRNTVYLSHMMFVFDRYRRKWPARCECDSMDLNGEINERGFNNFGKIIVWYKLFNTYSLPLHIGCHLLCYASTNWLFCQVVVSCP